VFPVKYELSFYILFRIISVFKGLVLGAQSNLQHSWFMMAIHLYSQKKSLVQSRKESDMLAHKDISVDSQI
jgi:hypothetical protein